VLRLLRRETPDRERHAHVGTELERASRRVARGARCVGDAVVDRDELRSVAAQSRGMAQAHRLAHADHRAEPRGQQWLEQRRVEPECRPA
jgi:hypothetical protein